MAETYREEIKFHPSFTRPLIVSNRNSVPQSSIIEWSIKVFDDFYLIGSYYKIGLIFSLYFSKESPFSWKRESLHIYGNNLISPFYSDGLIKLAESIAEIKGDFKWN